MALSKDGPYRFIRWAEDIIEYEKEFKDVDLDFQDRTLRPEHRILMMKLQDEENITAMKHWLEANWTVVKKTVLQDPLNSHIKDSIVERCATKEWDCNYVNCYNLGDREAKVTMSQSRPWLVDFNKIFEVYIIKNLPLPIGSILFEPYNAQDPAFDPSEDEGDGTWSIGDVGHFIKRGTFVASWHPEPVCRMIGKRPHRDLTVFAHMICSDSVHGFVSHMFHPKDGDLDITINRGLKMKITKIMQKMNLPYYDDENECYDILKNVCVVVTSLY